MALRDLPNMSKQEIFDKVAKHLLTQGEPSIDPNADKASAARCMYRSPNGLQCAVGCLIGEDEYQPSFEGENSDHVISAAEVELTQEKEAMLINLQRIHDEEHPELWKDKLEMFANNWGLEWRHD